MAAKQKNPDKKDKSNKQADTTMQKPVGSESGRDQGREASKGKNGSPPQGASRLKGINRLPQWLHQEKGLSDTMAGSLVVLVSGGLIMLFVFVLAKIWPAAS